MASYWCLRVIKHPGPVPPLPGPVPPLPGPVPPLPGVFLSFSFLSPSCLTFSSNVGESSLTSPKLELRLVVSSSSSLGFSH